MRVAGFTILLFALSWPALARQDQSQTAPAQTPPPAAQAQPGSNQASTPATQSQAPAGEAQAPAQSAPPPSQAPAQASTPEGAQQGPATAAPPAAEKSKRKTSKKKKHWKKKTSKSHKPHEKAEEKKEAESTADAGPRRIVIRRGGTSDTGGQLEPGVPETEATRERKTNEQLLHATETRLKDMSGRKLTAEQQDMARQIQFYIQQARAADREGDLGRARNLAAKANMLCDALARQ